MTREVDTLGPSSRWQPHWTGQASTGSQSSRCMLGRELDPGALEQLAITDGLCASGGVLVEVPVCPNLLFVLVIHELAQVGKHAHLARADGAKGLVGVPAGLLVNWPADLPKSLASFFRVLPRDGHHAQMVAPAEMLCNELTPRATKGKSEIRTVNAEQAGRHKAELLHQKSVAPDAHGKSDHGDIGHEKRNPAVAGKPGMRGQQKRSHQAAQRARPFKNRNPVHRVSLALCFCPDPLSLMTPVGLVHGFFEASI